MEISASELADRFPKRARDLTKIKRFWGLDDQNPQFRIMFYRTNLKEHGSMVRGHLRAALPVILKVYPEFNVAEADAETLVHDDPEVITGDIQLVNKLNMSPEQLAILAIREREAIDLIIRRRTYPRLVNRFRYKELLLHAHHKDTLESQVVSWLDKKVAEGEAWHELVAGDGEFWHPCQNYPGVVLPKFWDQYPMMRPLLEIGQPPFMIGPVLSEQQLREIARGGKPYTKTSIFEETPFDDYNFWKRAVLEEMGTEGLRLLTSQTEFF